MAPPLYTDISKIHFVRLIGFEEALLCEQINAVFILCHQIQDAFLVPLGILSLPNQYPIVSADVVLGCCSVYVYMTHVYDACLQQQLS